MSDCLTAQIVELIAEVERKNPMHLDFVLHDYIDTDALESLMEHDSTSWTLEFNVANHDVLVTGDGRVEVDGNRQEMYA